MKKTGLKTIMIFAAAIALIVAGVFIYLQQPQFGALPKGERLARIERSPNYVNGTFRNQINTPMLTTEQSEWSMWMETLFTGQGQTRPPGPIPAIKTDLKSLDLSRDLVIWLGHSSFYVQLAGKRFLIDPVFSHNAAPLPWINTEFKGSGLYTVDDIPPIDVLLISHDHYDHLDYNSIVSLKPKVRQVIVGLGVGADFEAWGYDMTAVHEADWKEAITIAPGLQVHVMPARHFSGRTFIRNKTLWVSFALISPQRRLFFSGDTGYGPHFAEIGRQFGPFDLVALDMGQYDPRWANVHMNPEQAAQAAEELRTHALLPQHVGRFSLAPHDWNDPFKRILAASQKHHYALWTPQPGQPVYLDAQEQKFSHWWESIPVNAPAAQPGNENG
ncbi:MBL fold metallo-hydrolase [Pantoea cypripedii]|uniref:MBL fold metallo-hydrolase n=1 Tax=Pantoea cypripedii TaxID=55209 RepID=A0A6B9GGK5_PANCY|nr:MBL fold metallo-hydrolase [Pantoea cypripedii]QGY32416.1 MBL fold metallo-hydrolase [Pantoea cypripedii]